MKRLYLAALISLLTSPVMAQTPAGGQQLAALSHADPQDLPWSYRTDSRMAEEHGVPARQKLELEMFKAHPDDYRLFLELDNLDLQKSIVDSYRVGGLDSAVARLYQIVEAKGWDYELMFVRPDRD